MLTGLILALPLVAPPSDAWELRGNFLAAPRVEVIVPSDLARAAAEREVEPGGFLDVRAASSGDLDLPRILALTSPGEVPRDLTAPLAAMGLELTPTGFLFRGRGWDSPQDGIVATFEDPGRGGLPVTLWYANSDAALAAYMAGLEPTFVPGFSAFRSGEVELEGALASSGRLQTAELDDRRVAWLARFETDKRLTFGGFEFRVPTSFDPDRAQNYLRVLEGARDRTFAWADDTGTASEQPVAAIGVTHVTVHGHVEEMLRLLGDAVLSRVNPVTGRVHVLLGAGVPDDGGAAVAQSTASRLLGPPAAAWLGPAAGVAGAGEWWDVELELWVAHLADSGLVPDLATVLAGSGSPHLIEPCRAFWFRTLLATEGAGHLRDLWVGKVELDPVAEQAGFSAALEVLVAERKADLAAWRQDRAARAEVGAWRAGAALVPGPKGAGYGSLAAGESLAELAALGASSFSLGVQAYRKASEPQRPGRLHSIPIHASEPDAVLASIAAAGRAVGLTSILTPHLLSTRHGSHTADDSLSTVGRIEDFFGTYEPFLVHYALLAELAGVDVLCIGTALPSSTMPPSLEPEDAGTQAMWAAKRDGWRDLATRASDSFLGLVTYTAGSLAELSEAPFEERIDLLSVELFTSLEPQTGSSRFDAPKEAAITSRITGKLTGAVEIAQARGLRLHVTAIGFASTTDAWRRPHLMRGETSPETQALLYRALAEALRRVEERHPGVLVGLHLWNWSSYPLAGGLADRGFTPQNKPAAEVLPAILAPPAQGGGE
ncbi:MAG: hypothetical protein P1V81_10230 [Planctomycetota bacterium]|nr:hypothetical protein [Planctomycetota bacterium]